MIQSHSTESVKNLERAWIRHRATSRETLDERVRSTYEYAIRLAALNQLKTRNGIWINVAPILNDFRHDLVASMRMLSDSGWHFPQNDDAMHGPGILAWEGNWHRSSLMEFYPSMGKMLHQAIRTLYQTFPDLDAFSLQDTLTQKRLVLALGGGGGTGYVHLCLFQWLEELNITPAFMTGTSMGGLLAYIRALQTHYDAALTTLKLPGFLSLTKNLRPNFGPGEYGLMGMWKINLESIVFSTLQGLGYNYHPTFRDLKIPFACVSSGIIRKQDITDSFETRNKNPLSFLASISPLALRHAIKHAAQIGNLVMSEKAVTEVTFGADDLTQSMSVVDAVAFSALVPGVLTYEVPRNHYRSREILDIIFQRDNIYRLADGGLVSNVPVRAALRAIQSGNYGHENVYILGIDVFAPQGSDGIFYPLEQIANYNAIVDAKYADSFVRLKYLLSPVNMVPLLGQLKWLNHKFRKAFETEMKIIQYALTPLRPLSSLDLIGF